MSHEHHNLNARLLDIVCFVPSFLLMAVGRRSMVVVVAPYAAGVEALVEPYLPRMEEAASCRGLQVVGASYQDEAEDHAGGTFPRDEEASRPSAEVVAMHQVS